MTIDRPTDESSLPDYPALFQKYLLRSVTVVHKQIEADAPQFLPEASERALHILNFALALDHAWPGARDLLLLLAPKMEMAGHRDDWLPYLQRGLTCSQQQNDPLASAELQWQIGHLYRLVSQFDRARQVLEASAADFAVLGNANGQARALNRLAHMAWHQRDFAAANKLATAALDLLPDADPERATSFSTLGLVAVSEQRLQDATNHIEEALRIRKEQHNWQQMAWNMQHLGHVLRHQGDYGQATQYYEQAIHILTEIQDRYNLAIAQMELGIVYWIIQQPIRALELYGLAELYFRKAQDTLHLAKILTNRGLGYLTLREWQQAIETFTVSADLYMKLDNLQGHLNALDGLGLVYTGMGAYDKAIGIFSAALDQLSSTKNDPGIDLLGMELTAHLHEAQVQKARQLNAPFASMT